MSIKLDGIQKTLLIPLWSRAKLSEGVNPIIMDSMALKIIDRIDYDFKDIENNIPYFTKLMLVVRALEIDRKIKEYILNHPKATIISLGCGLDTAFYRIDNGMISWYDVDLPDVIKIRERLISENRRNTNISGSIFEIDWVKKIQANNEGMLIISGGVLPYFKKSVIKYLFNNIINNFKNSEIVFDTQSILGNVVSNIGTQIKGMKSANFQWGIKDARTMEKWDARIVFVEQYPLFSKTNIDKSWSKGIKTITNLSDKFNMANIVHLRISD